MKVEFDSARLQRLCSTEKELTRRFGPDGGRTTMRRLQQLEAAPTLADMRALPGHCHELAGGREGQLAVSLAGAQRLVFRPKAPVPRKGDGGLDWEQVQAVVVLGIVDYH